MPRTRLRNSARACCASARASRTSSFAAAGSVSMRSLASPRSMVSITSRCWAPSCRSRSIRRSSPASASSTAERLSRRVSTWRRSSRVSDVQMSPEITARWSTATSCVRDAAIGSRATPPSTRSQVHWGVAPSHAGADSRASVGAPDRDDQEELDDDQREVDADVQDVAPARLVDELGADEVHEAAAQRLVGMRDQEHRIGETRSTSFEPGDEPRSLDAEDDQDDPDPGEEARDTRREGRHDRCERDDADEEPDQDERDRVPGRRMERRQQERADRVPDAGSVAPRRKRDPRRSERRFAGDASREQAGQDKKEPDDEDRRGDH